MWWFFLRNHKILINLVQLSGNLEILINDIVIDLDYIFLIVWWPMVIKCLCFEIRVFDCFIGDRLKHLIILFFPLVINLFLLYLCYLRWHLLLNVTLILQHLAHLRYLLALLITILIIILLICFIHLIARILLRMYSFGGIDHLNRLALWVYLFLAAASQIPLKLHDHTMLFLAVLDNFPFEVVLNRLFLVLLNQCQVRNEARIWEQQR